MLYKSKKNNNVFIVNYKCGFSTFENLMHHDKVVEMVNINDILKNIKKYNIYIIVRNPISRVISFYKDKFIQAPQSSTTFNSIEYKKFLNQYFKNFTNIDLTKNEFNINILCECLKKGYSHEGHLVPQSDGDYKILSKYTNINIIKMEDDDFNENILNILNHDNILKVNNTQGVKYNEIITDFNTKYLIDVFEQDYKTFGYHI